MKPTSHICFSGVAPVVCRGAGVGGGVGVHVAALHLVVVAVAAATNTLERSNFILHVATVKMILEDIVARAAHDIKILFFSFSTRIVRRRSR
jgi:hypothetical protein